MGAIAAISVAGEKLYKAWRDARGVVPKEEMDKKKNFKRANDDFDERVWKMAGEASSKLDVGRVMDEYDAEIKRLKREEEDLLAEDPLGRMTVAVQDRLVLLQRERKELQQVAEANAKAAETRERAAQRGQQTEEARKKTLEKSGKYKMNCYPWIMTGRKKRGRGGAAEWGWRTGKRPAGRIWEH